ncbi:type I restriction endonuclease subunit R, EcoR124 family [Succinivibrio dextrinosolvens]|uniref:type I restriction endonuclease subunit R, EcoR124 family n=1 Tax=Succinivibrio dextrinosolvens TaxID=83771 RepID=UPI00247B14EA|nr:HsdR family type I site-specific deoxyribonuclease [Succinivibrio dextrinosolvens]
MSQLESEIEERLIKQLITGDSQWTYRGDLHTEADLWNNIRQKLDENNIAKLQGVKLTDPEMEQVKEFIRTQGESPYKAAVWLAGERGLAQIPLKRDDASLGEIYLDAVNNREIAGGRSTYEVINQYVSFKTDPSDRDRRFDVTLLINGFPLIHIELKNQDHGYIEAFNQIKKYIGEGKFSGLFGLVQMFVISNGTDTKYISAATHEKFNEKFLASWVNKDNERVDNYLDFAREVLNIPQAHLMVGRYCIIDANEKKIILLRPYQIHAIEAVKEASKRHESGYIWHTTGSGKTITSFNVTRNLLEIPAIDKSVFLIDRKDLDQQTTLSFKGYAQNTGDIIENTDNTTALEKCLSSKDRTVIVATRQKLDCLMEKCNKAIEENNPDAYYYKLANKIKEKNVAFVVDECHRAISSAAKDAISKFFNSPQKEALWYGFTGTPIFDENKKAANGNAARTTEKQYGRCLHKYTIKEALHDKAVLGFKVQSSGFSNQELMIVADSLDIKLPQGEIDSSNRKQIESQILETYKAKTGKEFYDNEKHREEVINFICNKSLNLLNLSAQKGNAFAGILTCQNIATAQKFYNEFKEFIKAGKVRESVRKFIPDFPKIAITYSVGENEDGSEANQSLMKQSIADYNAMYNTNYSLENINAYNSDLNDRLARKKGKYQLRENQVDLVIVVDRLLTGFDGPCISTLFIDRPPMSPQGIIQAFSRTNRLFTKEKTWGNVVTFQMPAIFKDAYESALSLYSNGGGTIVLAPTYKESRDLLTIALHELKTKFLDPKKIDIDGSDEELKLFVKLYQNFDKAFNAIKTYEEWDEENTVLNPGEDNEIIINIAGYELSKEDFDNYVGKYNNAINELKRRKTENDIETVDIDISYELETISQQEVNYDYLISLMQKYVVAEEDDIVEQISDPAIDKYIESICEKNPKLGEVIKGVWNEIKSNPIAFRGKQVVIVINERIEKIIHDRINAFCDEWCVEKTDMNYYSKYYNPSTGLEIRDINKFCYFDEFREKNSELSKLRYHRTVRELAEQIIVEDILPLRNR